MRISVIVPAYNEEKFVEKSLNSLVQQTLKPRQIIVVNDGSTDQTLKIVSKFPVTIVSLPVKKKAMIERVPYVLKAGSHILEDFDYVGILDADTILEPEYYEKLVRCFQKDENLGIAGGKLNNQPSTGLILGLIPYVYGCNRLYTKKCWLKINGGKVMKPVPTWDTYHNILARMLGFKTRRFDYIQSWALRQAGKGKAFNKGYCSYQIGYYWQFLLLRAIKNYSPKMIAGYLKAKFSGEKQYPIKPYVRYLQSCRLKRLLIKSCPEA